MPPQILRVDRGDFLNRYWQYSPGEHVTGLGPTGWGKTELMCGLLGRSASRQLPAVVFCMKPVDETIDRWKPKLHYRQVATWSKTGPPLSIMNRHPDGYLLWPKTNFDDIWADRWHQREQFMNATMYNYKHGKCITVFDEVESLVNELEMKEEVKTILRKGRGGRNGAWSWSQRPADIPLHCYSMANHLFLAKDPDVRTQRRYDEIGGFDPGLVRYVVATQLAKYEWLYCRREDSTMCIVGK